MCTHLLGRLRIFLVAGIIVHLALGVEPLAAIMIAHPVAVGLLVHLEPMAEAPLTEGNVLVVVDGILPIGLEHLVELVDVGPVIVLVIVAVLAVDFGYHSLGPGRPRRMLGAPFIGINNRRTISRRWQ